MSVSGTYSSTVFKTKDEYFETVSVDLKRANERTGYAVVLFRRIEKQCIGYDDNDVFMVTPDEWSYFDERRHELHNISRSQITRKLNEITTWAVQKFDVDDVKEMTADCVLVRNEKKMPFNTEYSNDNLLRDGQMQKFEAILHESFGRHKTYNMMRFFRKHFPELPNSATENFEAVMPTMAAEPTYTAWGAWS